jgi:hypothetical protein
VVGVQPRHLSPDFKTSLLWQFQPRDQEHGDTRSIRDCSTVEWHCTTALRGAIQGDRVQQPFRPGVSIAAVALKNGINTNLLARWRRDYFSSQVAGETTALVPVHVVEVPSIAILFAL